MRYGRWSYLFTMASMVIVVNSVVGGATVALVFALARLDWTLLIPIIVWLIGYAILFAVSMPRITRYSEELAKQRSVMTGRIVDSYTNIQTVKLFAHLEREDEHARDALADHNAAFHGQTRLITFLNLARNFGCISVASSPGNG